MSWARVQGTSGQSAGAVNNYSLAFPGNVTAGNLLLVSMTSANAIIGTVTVKDSTGTYTFTQDASVVSDASTGHQVTYLWHLVAPASGPFTVKVTATGSWYIPISIEEFSSAGLASVGTAVTNYSNTGSTPTPGTPTVAGNALVYGVLGNQSSSTPTAGTGFTLGSVIPFASGVDYGNAPEYALNQTTNIAVSWNQTAAIWTGVAVAYKETPIGLTVSGPASGGIHAPSTNFTVTPAATDSDTITFSDGGAGGTFTPTSLTWTQSSAAKTFTYTPATTGAITLTLTSANGGTVTGSPLTYTSIADLYNLTGPSTGTSVGAATFTITPTGTVTSDTVNLSDGGAGGVFSPTSLSWASSSSAKTFTYTPPHPGTLLITCTSINSNYVGGSPSAYAVSIGFTVTGPTSGVDTVTSTNFTVTPASATTDSITFSDGSSGVFAPTSLSWTNSSTPQTFTYTPSVTGNLSLTLASLYGQTVTGSPFSYFSSAVVVGAYVSKWGKLAIFNMAAATGKVNGVYPPGIVSAVNSDATVKVNGSSVQLGPVQIPLYSYFTPTPDGPFVAYLLRCGSVQSIPMSCGATTSYTAPSATWNGDGGGSGLTVGTPVLASGVMAYTLTFGGAGYIGNPTVGIAGGTKTVQATAIGIITGGSVTSVGPLTGGPQGYGLGYSGSLSGTQSFPAPTTVTFTGTVTNGSPTITGLANGNSQTTSVIGIGMTATSAGNIPSSTTVTTINSSTSVTLSANATASGSVTIVFTGVAATFTCSIGNYILDIPVTTGGTGFTSPPTFTITDTGSGAGAVAAPVMTGPAVTDTLTYSAAPHWVTTNLGDTAGATNAPMTNFIGQLEHAGNLPGFNQTPTALMGGNLASVPAKAANSSIFAGKNKRLASNPWTMGTGTTYLTFDSNYFPATWTPGGIISSLFYGYSTIPYVAQYLGTWTIQYDDAFYAGQAPSATTVTMTTGNFYVSCTLQAGYPHVSGTTVTIAYTVAFTQNPQTVSNATQLSLNVTAPSDGKWHLSNLWIFAPGNTLDRSNPYAVDDNVIAALTGPTGRGPSSLRFMDSVFDIGGQNNYVDPSDLQNAASYSFHSPYEADDVNSFIFPNIPPNTGVNTTPAGTVTFNWVRFINTNVNSSTYSWSSTRCYSSQPWANSGTDSFGSYLDMTAGPSGPNDNGDLMRPTYGSIGQWLPVELRSSTPHGLKSGQYVNTNFSFYGTLTNGSPTVTGLVNTSSPYSVTGIPNLIAGIPVTGSGIPANTTILSVNSPTSITLSNNATSSGTFQITSVTTVASTTYPTVAFANNGTNYMVWVTGPYTIALNLSTYHNPDSGIKQYMTATTEIPCWLPVQIFQPSSPACIPYEFAASVVAAFPNCAYWCNLSATMTDACITAVAQKVAAHIGPTNDVILELGNEHWNTKFLHFFWIVFLTRITAYMPSNTTLWPFTNTLGQSSGYTTTGSSIPSSIKYWDMIYVLHASHVYDVFEAAWVAAGLDPSRIKRSFGTQWSGTGSTSVSNNLASAITSYKVPGDYLDMGAYYFTPNSPSTTIAANPAGYPVGTPGNWPVDAINDFYRHQILYSNFFWTYWKTNAQAIAGTGLKLACYECSTGNPLSGAPADYLAVVVDCMYHPSWVDTSWTYFLALQQGNPTIPNAQGTISNFFTIYQVYQPYNWTGGGASNWWLGGGVSQSPGYGSSSLYMTQQGGSPGTRYSLGYVQQNASPSLQAFQNWNNVTTPFYAPTDVSLTPAPGATGISDRAIIVIQFNEPMLGSTITTSSFTLNLGSQSIAGTVAYNPTTWAATFTPASKLLSPNTFTARVSTAVTNAEGTALATPITWSFTTGSKGGSSLKWFSGLSRPTARLSV